jgi:siderophore synthetase component
MSSTEGTERMKDRGQLTADVAAALKETVKAALHNCFREFIADQLYEDHISKAVDEFVTERLAGVTCMIEFTDGKVGAFVGVGPGDIAFLAEVELSIDDYAEIEDPFPAQVEDIREQLTGINKFIDQLVQLKAQLQASLDHKEQQLAALDPAREPGSQP